MYHPAQPRLLCEAVQAGLNAADLEALTRKYQGVYARLAWIDRLEQDGDREKAIVVAKTGESILYLPEERNTLRARLGALYMAHGRDEEARETWRRTWSQDASTVVLCQIWNSAGPAAPDFFRSVLEQAYSEETAVSSDLQTRIEILLGDIELPLARLQAASLKDWWKIEKGRHPADIVLPLLLRLGTGQAELGPDLEVTRYWRSTDLRSRRHSRFVPTIQPRWSLLVDQVVSTHQSWLVDAPTWRASAARVLSEMVDAAFSARATTTYGRLALLLTTLIEVGTIAGDPHAKATVQSILRRYPRHRALSRMVEEQWSFSLLREDDGS
ncbi:MAG: hypothetical protein GXP62_16210 [Oligoflexia bacterium]|nr:hypothetical protein [Oligoflexia bacterium]